MSEITTPSGKLHQSRDLRGLLDYARRPRVWITAVSIAPLPVGGGSLEVRYSDGAVGTDTFADFSVLCGWLRARRSWHGADLFVNSTACSSLSAVNPQV
jgi:hypothetical protein